MADAAIAQLGERQTEDLKVPSWILGLGRHGRCLGIGWPHNRSAGRLQSEDLKVPSSILGLGIIACGV